MGDGVDVCLAMVLLIAYLLFKLFLKLLYYSKQKTCYRKRSQVADETFEDDSGMKVVIRVDSSTQVGSRHLMRCLTLAGQIMREHRAEVHFICRDLPGNLSHLVQKSGFGLHLLPRHEDASGLPGYAAWLTVPQEVDAEETKAVLESFGQVDCLVVDSYALDMLRRSLLLMIWQTAGMIATCFSTRTSIWTRRKDIMGWFRSTANCFSVLPYPSQRGSS